MSTMKKPEGSWHIREEGTVMSWQDEYCYSGRIWMTMVEMELDESEPTGAYRFDASLATLQRQKRFDPTENEVVNGFLSDIYSRLKRGVATLSTIEKLPSFMREEYEPIRRKAIEWVNALPSEASFAHRAEHVWKRIVKQDAQWRALLAAGKVYEVEQALEKVIRAKLSSFSFYLAYRDAHPTVYFHTGVEVTRLAAIMAFIDRMPDCLKAHWTFVAGFPARPTLTLMDDEKHAITLKDMQCRIVSWHDDGRYHLEVACKALNDSYRRNRTYHLEALRALLCGVLGDLTMLRYIERVVFSPKPLTSKAVPLPELPQILAKNGHQPVTDPALAFKTAHYSYPKTSEIPAWDKWRQGPFVGETDCAILPDRYWKKDTSLLEAIEMDGVRAGFFIVPVERLSKTEATNRLQDLRDHLLTSCGKSLRITGEAIGKSYALLDVLLWDQAVVFGAAKAFARQAQLLTLRYQNFAACCSTMTLWETHLQRKPASGGLAKKAKSKRHPKPTAPVEAPAWTFEGPMGKA